MDIDSLVLGLFGGGTLIALIAQQLAIRNAKKERKLQQLETQIRELYGPLFYLVSQSERLFSLIGRFDDAYKAEFIDKQYVDNPTTRERINQESTDTLKLKNQYATQVEANNEKISQLLNDKFSYIDPDDIELFLLFFEHYSRMTTERNEGGILKTPFLVYRHIGDISYLRPEFIERVDKQFLRKKNELDRLSK